MSMKICSCFNVEKSCNEYREKRNVCLQCERNQRKSRYTRQSKEIICECGLTFRARGVHSHKNSAAHHHAVLLNKYKKEVYDYDDFDYPLHILEKFI